MQINNYSIDFKLEDESNVPDIVASISEWSQERGLIFSEVYIDEEQYFIDNLPESKLEEIETINCIVQSKSDMVFSTVDEGIGYCDKVIGFIKKSIDEDSIDLNEIQNLVSGIDWLFEVYQKIVQLIGLDINEKKYKDRSVKSHIDDLEKARERIIDIKDEKTLIEYFKNDGNIFSEIKEIFSLLLISEEMRSLIMKSIDSPDVLVSSLQSIKEDLSEELSNIEDTAIAYQSGKDSEGSEKLNRFIGFVYRYTRTCYQVVPVFGVDLSTIEINSVSLEEKNSNLNEMLNEIMEVMENNDIISLADILEYEIMPSLKELDGYVDLLLNRIDAKPD